MENSTNSFTKQAALSCNDNDQYSVEESQSGWTDYLDDFGRENSCCISTLSDFGSSSPSMESDAASYAAWKLLSKAEVRLEKTCKNLNFKKRRTIDLVNDDSLEDTASSPVNSPKEKRNNGATSHGLDLQTTEQRNHEIDCGVNGWKGNDNCTQLKKRGLCLVPLSILINYRG